MNSAIIYRGPSMLDGKTEIVVVVTGMESASTNAKTGGMVQTYIVIDSLRPADAINSGADAAICGACPHRKQPDGTRSCYVNMATGLNAVGRQMLAGKYPEITPADASRLVAGRAVRLGTYGDPAAVPAHVWRTLIAFAGSHTGYTHQWRSPVASEFRGLCMASCDSEADRDAAKLAGWRTFRVRRLVEGAPEAMTQGEIVCPASAEGGKKVTCEECRLCGGTAKSAKDIAIIDHSPRANAVRRRLAVIQPSMAA